MWRGGQGCENGSTLLAFFLKSNSPHKILYYSKKPFFFLFCCFHGNGASHQPLSQWLQQLNAAFCSFLHGRKMPWFLFVIFVNGQGAVIVKSPWSDTCRECVQQRELHLFSKERPSSSSLLLSPWIGASREQQELGKADWIQFCYWRLRNGDVPLLHIKLRVFSQGNSNSESAHIPAEEIGAGVLCTNGPILGPLSFLSMMLCFHPPALQMSPSVTGIIQRPQISSHLHV